MQTNEKNDATETTEKTGPRPSEELADIMKKARFISSLVGADIANVNYRINWITIVVITCITIYFIFSITSIVGMFAEDWTFMLEASCMLGSVLQGITKLISGIRYTKDFVSTRLMLERLYAELQDESDAYDAILQRSCVRLRNVIKMVGLIYLVTVLGVVLLPFVLLMRNGSHHLIMHFFIPGLDVSTDFGYFVTLGVHLVVLLAGSFGLFAGDLFVLIFLVQPLLFLDVLKLRIAELNDRSEKEGRQLRNTLNGIIWWHQFYTAYNVKCNEIFYYIVTMQVTTSGISILCTLYIVVAGDWPGVYLYLLFTVSGLYIYCILGTKIEICNDNFCIEIYNIKWYNFQAVEYKMICMMLMKSQRPANIKVAGMLPLSVTTALQISKTLYGIFTIMLRVLD